MANKPRKVGSFVSLAVLTGAGGPGGGGLIYSLKLVFLKIITEYSLIWKQNALSGRANHMTIALEKSETIST